MKRSCWNPRRGCQTQPRGELRLSYQTADGQSAVLDVPYCDHHYAAIRRRLEGMGRRTNRAFSVDVNPTYNPQEVSR